MGATRQGFLALAVVGSTLAAGAAQASPLYPWQQFGCAQIDQDDRKNIGALCAGFDSDLQVVVVNVYYFGELFDNRSKYTNFYTNLSANNSGSIRRGMKLASFGDGNNLLVTSAFTARYIMTNNFQNPKFDYPAGRNFGITFQAEQRKPTRSPPFDFDDNFTRTYSGKLPTASF
jgi:hypothetical protein